MGLKGMKGLERKLKKLEEDLRDNPADEAEKQLRKIQNTQRRTLVNRNTMAFGVLAEGLEVSRRNPRNAAGQFVEGVAVSLESTAPYSGFIEYGTGQRQRFGPEHAYWDKGQTYRAPSLTRSLVFNIKAWMIVKGITPLSGDMSTSAYLIARQISNYDYPQRSKPKGTPAQPFFWAPLMYREHIIRRRIRQSVYRAIH